MSNTMRAVAVMLVALLATGCAATPGRTHADDPMEGLNRGIYKFNDTVDRATLKPVAKGYRKITPQWLRTGISNFFNNLQYPSTIINQFLQGKGKAGLKDTGRFVVNTTVGIAGLIDVATKLGLEANDEDFGQTLAVWGVGSGPYLNLPLFGPSSVRDAPSRIFDFFSDPLAYTDIPWEAEWGQRLLNVVQTRAQLLPLEGTLERTYDPYVFVRDAWVQRREFEIFDGNPPAEELPEDFIEEDAEQPQAEPQVGSAEQPQAEPQTPAPAEPAPR